MYRLAYLLLILSLAGPAMTQPYTSQERLRGYAQRNDTTVFLFDEGMYGDVRPNNVVVTGSFRAWNQDMNDPRWQLVQSEPSSPIWKLPVDNDDLQVVQPGSHFKFRLDDGEWVQPRSDAPNEVSGNHVFMMGVSPPHLRAELHGPRAVWATVTGTGVRAPFDPAEYRLKDAHGHEVPVAAALPNTADTHLIVPGEDLEVGRLYILEIPSLGLKSRCHFDGIFRELYSDKELGANVSEDRAATTFRIFAPRAESVVLYLYIESEGGQPHRVVELERDPVGVWEAILHGDLHGTYYDFTVHGPDDPGNHFFETHPVHVSDPYARVNVDAFGRSRVWHRTTPATPLANGIPPMKDVVAYEVHVQDFTDLLPVSDDLKGTIPAMVVPGLRNSRGENIGFDYLLDLGINVVHLMPVQEFLHYPDAVWREAFEHDPYMIEQGINLENYQWGYRTTHAFAVETKYRQKGTDYGAQRNQFRDLVQAFHDNGIAVIVDFVFNHTGENMDGGHFLLNFNVLDQQYYYRTVYTDEGTVDHIGAFGNETKSEDRPMVQRWIIDQCLHFINEFGVDGFRIDLAGQTDEQTLKALRAAIGPDKIVYGEPWIGSNDPRYEANADWDWYKEDSPITFFQDDTRNAVQGPPSGPKNKNTDRGWAGGKANERENVKRAILNSFPEERHPDRGINYIDIHDDWTLADRYASSDWDGRFGIDDGRYRLAATLLLTSLGPVVLHGGSEMIRSKGSAPLVELVKEHGMGATYIHGKRDTYNLRNANHFIWENLGRTKQDPGIHNDYSEMMRYWRGLIHFRLSEAGAPLRIAERPRVDYITWIEPNDEHLLGYIIADSILVLANSSGAMHVFHDVELPEGNWRLIGNGRLVDHENGVSGPHDRLVGGEPVDLAVPKESALIWVRTP